MALSGDDFFGPIMEGFSAFREGVKLRRDKEDRAANRALKQREFQLDTEKFEETKRKTLRDEADRELAAKQIETQSPRGIYLDPTAAANQVRLGKSPQPFIKFQFNPEANLMQKFKVNIAQQIMKLNEEMVNNPNADQAALEKQLDGLVGINKVIGGATLQTERRRKNMEQIEKAVSADPETRKIFVDETKRAFGDYVLTPLRNILVKRAGANPEEVEKALTEIAEAELPKLLTDIPYTQDTMKSMSNYFAANAGNFDKLTQQFQLQNKFVTIANTEELRKVRDKLGRDPTSREYLEMSQNLAMKQIMDNLTKRGIQIPNEEGLNEPAGTLGMRLQRAFEKQIKKKKTQDQKSILEQTVRSLPDE